jgi:hypothetical protein
MSSTNYPYDQDKAFETFMLVSYPEQIAKYGKTFGQADLLPVDYAKLSRAFFDGTIPFIPLREFVFSKVQTTTFVNNEDTNFFQSENLGNALQILFNYYLNNLFNDYKIAMGIVTDISSEVQHIAGVNDAELKITIKVLWFAPSFSDYV